MIKIKGTQDQVLDKNDIVISGIYSKKISFCGIPLWSTESNLKNEFDENKEPEKKVGFGK